MDKFLAVVVTAAIVLFACFSLGVFGGDGVLRVDDKDYNEFTFSGNLKDGRFSGYGAVNFQDGDRFGGNFTEGRFDGRGVFYATAGHWNFDGVFQGGRIGGGTLNIDDSDPVTLERSQAADTLTTDIWRYEGGLNELGQSGAGRFVFADGSVYTGGFSHGLADGEGELTDASGRIIYKGGFKDGLFDGQGTYFSSEGWSYEGGFKDGLFDGEGSVTTEYQTIRGVWEKGVQIRRYG